MDYKEKLYNLFEKFLIDNDIYSQFTTIIMERGNVTLKEVVDDLSEYPELLIHIYNFYIQHVELSVLWYKIVKDFKNEQGIYSKSN